MWNRSLGSSISSYNTLFDAVFFKSSKDQMFLVCFRQRGVDVLQQSLFSAELTLALTRPHGLALLGFPLAGTHSSIFLSQVHQREAADRSAHD